jgi:hypothetical protein
MHEHGRRTPSVLSSPRVATVVLFLTGGLVGVMAYHGSLTPLVWVLAVLLAVRFRTRLPRSDATWRGPATVCSLFVAGGVLGAIAYYGLPGMTAAFAGACVVALALAPAESV